MSEPRYLIVPGRGDSGPAHWQSRWQHRLAASRVNQHDWATPELAGWTRVLLRRLDESPTPAVLIAHSFGCLASVAAAYRRPQRVRALFLAAPANPARFEHASGLPVDRLAVPSVLISSRRDPWLASSDAASWARVWGCRHIDAGDAGHINEASGHGPWPAGYRWLQSLVAMAGAASSGVVPALAATVSGLCQERAVESNG